MNDIDAGMELCSAVIRKQEWSVDRLGGEMTERKRREKWREEER